MDGLENALIDEVNSRMNFYEYKYNVKILFWALRSSVNLGIVRRNSDLDIMFAYKNLNPFVCSGIHDILGHGLDLWGIDIEDIIKTISVNNQILYEAKDSTYSLWTISQQHVRGGCNYYFGIYSVLGTEYMYPTTSFIADTSEYFMMMFEKKIVIKQMLILIGKVVNEIKIYEQVSLYDYIYTMWRILLCHNLIDGGIPGENNIEFLKGRYLSEELLNVMDKYQFIYKETYSKTSTCFPIPKLNNFITDEYYKIKQIDRLLLPEKKKETLFAERIIKTYLE